MSLDKIISVGGMPGLYKVVAPLRIGGNIVESLIDKKRIAVSGTQKVTLLRDISVFTVEGEISLREVFLKMREHDSEVSKLSSKSESADLKTAIKKFLPNYDEERVHVSDMRKMVSWYAMLKDIVDFKEEVKEETTPAVTEAALPVEAEKEVAKPKAKAPKAKKVEAETSTEEKPVARKKAAKKSA